MKQESSSRHPKTAIILLFLGFFYLGLNFTVGVGLTGAGHGVSSHLGFAGDPGGCWYFAWIPILLLANSERRWLRLIAVVLLLVNYAAILSGDDLRFEADLERLRSTETRGWYFGLITYWVVIQLVAWLLIILRDEVISSRHRVPSQRTKR